MGRCKRCGKESITISNLIGYCADCIRAFESIPKELMGIHISTRRKFNVSYLSGLKGRFKCNICLNNCSLGKEVSGLCGNYIYDEGFKSVLGSFDLAYGSWYYDPHPTNCVAFPVCPAITGLGYPKYSLRPNGEVGYYNLAVFYATCSLNCLFCQNWYGRIEAIRTSQIIAVDELVNAALNDKVTCICYFGGDPTPNVIHAMRASRETLNKVRGRVLRICWETNGTVNPSIMREMARISLESGGIVKIDLKAWTPQVYEVLTGVNAAERVMENIKLVASMADLRDSPPLLVVSILLVPGYVDEFEVSNIAEFISSVNPEIPVVLLAFHPHFMLNDLPRTSRDHMYKAIKIMREHGIKHVYVGNEWLLGNDYS